MPSITLAYHTATDLSANLTYATLIAAASAYKTFTPVELFTPEKELTIDTPPITMGGRKVEHVLFSHYQYPIVISPKEFIADSAKLAFLRSLWDAKYIYLSYYNYATPGWGNFVEVNRGAKKFPVDYLKNIIYLPKVTFNFSGAKAV